MTQNQERPTVQFAIPAPYRRATDGLAVVEVAADTIAGAIEALREKYPDMASRLLTEKGTLNPLVNVYLNGMRLDGREALERAVNDGDRLVIMPVIGGGD